MNVHTLIWAITKSCSACRRKNMKHLAEVTMEKGAWRPLQDAKVKTHL